jgi:hypothetical protein
MELRGAAPCGPHDREAGADIASGSGNALAFACPIGRLRMPLGD